MASKNSRKTARVAAVYYTQIQLNKREPNGPQNLRRVDAETLARAEVGEARLLCA